MDGCIYTYHIQKVKVYSDEIVFETVNYHTVSIDLIDTKVVLINGEMLWARRFIARRGNKTFEFEYCDDDCVWYRKDVDYFWIEDIHDTTWKIKEILI